MELTEKISDWLTRKIAKDGNYSEDDLERIKYGIHINLMNIHKGVIIFLVAYFLGIIKFTIIGFIAFYLIRSYSFGIHAKKSITCLISSLFIIVGVAYLISFLKPEVSYVNVIIAFIVVLISVILYAPSDTQERPILPKYRDKMKKRAIRNTIIVFAIATLFVYLGMNTYATIFCVMSLIEVAMINPITYMIFRQRYNNYIYYLKGEY